MDFSIGARLRLGQNPGRSETQTAPVTSGGLLGMTTTMTAHQNERQGNGVVRRVTLDRRHCRTSPKTHDAGTSASNLSCALIPKGQGRKAERIMRKNQWQQ